MNQKIEENTDIISRSNSWRQRLGHVNHDKKYVLNIPKTQQHRKSNYSTEKRKRKVLVRESVFKIKI